MNEERLRRRRRRLWEEDPHCRFCGKKTVLPKDVPGAADGNMKGPAWDMATIEHLDSRYRDYRGWSTPFPEIERTTLACKECNQRRERRETLNQPIEELHERSQRHGSEADA